MLAMLGDFFFEINKNNYDRLIEKLTFSYAEHHKALGYRKDEPVGKEEQEFEMSGTLILQNIKSLDSLIELGQNKKPLLLTFGSGYAYWVTIREIEIKSSRFLSGGEALRRKFKVKLKRYYYEQAAYSRIFSAF